MTSHVFSPDYKLNYPNLHGPPQVNIHCIENFFTVRHFWTTCTCPGKQSFPWNFSLYWLYTFYHSGFLSNLRLPWKTDLTWNFSMYWGIFFIQDFWATYVCSQNFHCIEYTFYIQDFWATCACLEKQSLPWIYLLNAYFLSFRIFEQLALALKNRVALILFTVLKYFFYSGILSNLRLPWNFLSRGAAAPPSSYGYGPMV